MQRTLAVGGLVNPSALRWSVPCGTEVSSCPIVGTRHTVCSWTTRGVVILVGFDPFDPRWSTTSET